MPNCGSGLSAKMQERGGADLICISATSYWRMKGQGSLAGLMPNSDVNQVVFDLTPEIVANTQETPLLGLSGAFNPLLPHDEHLQRLWDAGVSGINPFMIKIYGDALVEQMDAIGIGWAREVEFVRTAHKRKMFTLAFAFSPAEARVMAEAGADAISSHCGATKGGVSGAKTSFTLEDATRLTQEIFDVAREVNPDVLLFAHGGPIEGPPEVQYVLEHTNAQGFIGGSAAERVPIEKAILATTQEYKALHLQKHARSS
jgi:predicted TIM-barrel enzyme